MMENMYATECTYIGFVTPHGEVSVEEDAA